MYVCLMFEFFDRCNHFIVNTSKQGACGCRKKKESKTKLVVLKLEAYLVNDDSNRV